MAKFRVVDSTTQAAAYNNGTGLKGGLTSYTGNQIQPRVKIGSGSEATGSILRAKGSRVFQVTDGASVADESVVVGSVYQILVVGTTDWNAMGLRGTAAVGAVFTATAAGAGSGTVSLVKKCTLANTANSSMTADTITVTCTRSTSATFRAKRLTNKYVWDFSDNKYRVGAAAVAASATSIEIVAVARA
jgi:hypothetical protein